MIAVVSIVCFTAVVMYGMRLWELRVRASIRAALEHLTGQYEDVRDELETVQSRTADTASKLVDVRSDLATVSGRLSDLQQTVKDANLSRIDRMEQQIQGIHARMGTRG